MAPPNSSPQHTCAGGRRPRISRWAIDEIQEHCDDQMHIEEIQALPRVSRSDFEVCGLLGEGGFSSVFEVRLLSPTLNDDESIESEQPILALKQIRRHKQGREEEDWLMAIYDLCNEISLLSRLSPHDNIVEIKGICSGTVSKASKYHIDGYFFLMERLTGTLSEKMNQWRKQLKQGTGRLPRLRRRHSFSSEEAETHGGVHLLSSQCMYKRISEVATGIARALSHLHSSEFQVVLRDLKPQNIGFDAKGNVKLFDFGMARAVHETENAELGGTFGYISPEALMGLRVGTEADIYSFGVILFELVTLARPFQRYYKRGKMVQKGSFIEEVVKGGFRPSLSSIPCRATARLISKSWDRSPRIRPSADRTLHHLNEILLNAPSEDVPLPGLVSSEIPKMVSSSRDPVALTQKSMPEFRNDHLQPLSPVRASATFRGIFRGLRPLSTKSARDTSDTTADTTTTCSIVIPMAEGP